MSRWYLHPKDCQCSDCKSNEKLNTPTLNHLSTLIIDCPDCHQYVMRWDTKKNVFVCWNCCKMLTSQEGIKIHNNGKTKLFGDGYD
jgi:hypothetical protein